MFNPFVDTTGLTDDELLDKINEIANRVSRARRAGLSYNMLSQLEQIYHEYNGAYQMRLVEKNSKNLDSTSIEIGTIQGDVTDAK